MFISIHGLNQCRVLTYRSELYKKAICVTLVNILEHWGGVWGGFEAA